MSIYKEILEEVYVGNVRRSEHNDLTIFKYSETCVADNRWNKINRLCRGIIFDRNGNLIAKPIPKFFNINERPETLFERLPWKVPYIIQEKVDGSCGILYHYNNKWQFATPGSLNSEQAIHGTEVLLPKYNTGQLLHDHTYICEIVYPGNKVVIDYEGQSFISLLTAFHIESGIEWSPDQCDQLALDCGFKRPKQYDYCIDNISSISFPENLSEGYVIFWPSLGLRVKAKDPRYVRVHKMLDHMTVKGVFNLITTNTFENIIKDIPPEIKSSFDDMYAMLQTAYQTRLLSVEQNYAEIPKTCNRKEFAIFVQQNIRKEYHSALFAKLDNKDISKHVWKMVYEDLSTN